MSRRKSESESKGSAAEVIHNPDNWETAEENPAEPEPVRFSSNTIEHVLAEACEIASLHPQDLLDWAIKKNEVTLINRHGVKIRVQYQQF